MADVRARIEAKRAALAVSREAQENRDFEAYEAACEEHGYDAVKCLVLPRFFEGLPTLVVVKAASADLAKIHRSRVTKAKRTRDGHPDATASISAAAEVGRACIVYPDEDLRAEIRDKIDDLYIRAGTVALDMARMRVEDEGKE